MKKFYITYQTKRIERIERKKIKYQILVKIKERYTLKMDLYQEMLYEGKLWQSRNHKMT